MELLKSHAALLPALFIVSQVEVIPFAEPAPIDGLDPELAAYAEQNASLHIVVKRADGTKCERCWNYSTHVGESTDYPTLCERCVAALHEIERDGGLAAGSSQS
jgi:isoleucyl-tRNA synthetase